MIQSQELRIGNYVFDIDGDILQIGEILNIGVKFKNTSLSSRYEKINPIPLTEEILLKFGFEKDENEIFHIDLFTHYLELMYSMDCYYPIYIQKAQMSSENEQRIGLNNLEFVHQLQNLYFALTGEELTFKNPLIFVNNNII